MIKQFAKQFISIIGALYFKIKAMIFYRVNPKRINIMKDGKIYSKVRIIQMFSSGKITLGARAKIHKNTKIVLAGGNLQIGENTTIGENSIINCFSDVIIGESVVTADRINFITNTHNYEDVTKPICEQAGEAFPICIGKGSWIGINVTFLPGSSIGRNCVVGANAVVKGIYPDYCVIGGIPSIVLKQYDPITEKWIRK